MRALQLQTIAPIVEHGAPLIVIDLPEPSAGAGYTHDEPPKAPDAIIDIAPVRETVLAALVRLAPGERLVSNANAKEPCDRDRLTELDYATQLWKEKEIKSVANVTRHGIRRFLEIAAEHNIRPDVTVLPLEQANQALRQIRFGGFRGASMLIPGHD